MPHSYSSCLVHCVFSTKGRKKYILPELQAELWPYLGGVARGHDLKALAIGGAEDHVHILLSIPPTVSLAKAIQAIKAIS